jgi:hypothetical protein
MFAVVKHPRNKSEYGIVRKECLQEGEHAIKDVVKVFVGYSPTDIPPQNVLKVKPKSTIFSEPGLYFRMIVSYHGKRTVYSTLILIITSSRLILKTKNLSQQHHWKNFKKLLKFY